ncbi:MAG: ribonuclease H [Chloroflexota bacterium]
MTSPQIDLYADGACSGNPGPGGYAFSLIAWDTTTDKALKTLHGSGQALDTTNNRMELVAALEGLKALSKPATLTVISDSQYLIKGMSEWITTWQANHWRNAKQKPIENQDLWMELIAAAQPHTITWTWTKGHDPAQTRYSYFNALVDEEATKQRDQAVRLATATPISAQHASEPALAYTGRLVNLNGFVVERIRKRADQGYTVCFQTHSVNVNDAYTLYLLPKGTPGTAS